MEDIECPRCKTTKYRNPNLKLMVNVCGHALCENCVELLFIKGSAACSQCKVILRRNNFRFQIFEDPSVERDLDVRRKILKDFNKKEEDFGSLLDYNNYLEEVENIIYNLANNIEIDSTKRKVEQYKKENKDYILKNRGKLSKEEEALEELLENEKYEKDTRKQQLVEEEMELQKSRRKRKEALIDDLMFSDRSAKDIIASYALKKDEPEFKSRPPKKKPRFSTGLKLQTQQVFLPVPKQTDVKRYCYSPLKFENFGPQPPSEDDVRKELLPYVRREIESEMAGGYIPETACQHALHYLFYGALLGCFNEITQ